MMVKFLKPKWFIFGILLGFILCCVAGHLASKKARFNHFTRFFSHIEPEKQYFPTAHELLSTAKHKVSRDKILVLIGGSSIFRGKGQNSDELWTHELQRLLGDNFKVLNYAVDSATFNSFGGVAYRILREEYPKIIFVTHSMILKGETPIDGIDVYSYLFWDAYYKNLFHSDEQEASFIRAVRNQQMKSASGAEKQILSFLDSLFYFRNLWNWMGYRFAFTAWTGNEVKNSFQARRRFSDESIPNLKKQALEYANDPIAFEAGVKRIAENVSGYVDVTKESLKIHNEILLEGRKRYIETFSPSLRSNVLCVLITHNTKHIAALSEKNRLAYWFIVNQSRDTLQDLGFNAMDVGKDFLPEDYLDEWHLLPSGGKKLASQVAQKVKFIADLKNF